MIRLIAVDVSVTRVSDGKRIFSHAFNTRAESQRVADTIMQRLDLFGDPGEYRVTTEWLVRAE